MDYPAKRQRVYRKRPDSDDEKREGLHRQSQDEEGADATRRNVGHNLSLASLVRQRKLQQRPRAGLAFSNEAQTASQLAGNVEDSVVKNQTSHAPNTLAGERRFTHETGQRIDDGTDRHMTAYVDSKLAQLRRDEEAANTSEQPLPASLGHTTAAHDRKPTSSGRLQEIDLGPSATELNVQRTQQARQRLEGGAIVESEPTKPPRIRLGRDGKPMKPRKRFRRRSEDVERDKLIDSLMKEARLEVYEKPEEVASGTGDDEAADERIAEAFRRDFLNQVEDRNARKPPPPPPGPTRGPKGEPETARGPKLGGSRSARAAMRAQQEAAKKH